MMTWFSGDINETDDSLSCAQCGILTNHTTAQHEAAMIPRCVDCDADLTQWTDDPEARRCPMCHDEDMMYRFTDWVDNYVKGDH